MNCPFCKGKLKTSAMIRYQRHESLPEGRHVLSFECNNCPYRADVESGGFVPANRNGDKHKSSTVGFWKDGVVLK